MGSSDITHIKSQQEKLSYLVNYDTMTGLANRRLLHERLEHAVHICRRSSRQFALMFIDLDNFKHVNDTLGHEAGDELLKGVVERLNNVIRESDTLARMGGDEFVLLAENIQSIDDALTLAQKMVDTLTPSFMIKHTRVYTSASVGISLFPVDGEDVDTLMKKADMAMYQSKEHGKSRFCFFSEHLESKLKAKILLLAELRSAIDKKEFELYYQPQVNIRENKIIGLEALIRWNHPERGMVLPGEFIKTAEEDTMIIQISEWVIMKSFATMRIWIDKGADIHWMAVNVSDKQFKDKDFAQKIITAIEFFKLSPSHIKLELTEKIVMDNPKEALQKLKVLRDYGIRLAIDDFGTGYSSLGYLKQFPIDQIKIDRSFVKDIGVDKSDEEITTAIIAMSRALGIEIIAEGVETKEQLDFLNAKDCFLLLPQQTNSYSLCCISNTWMLEKVSNFLWICY
jgi:diguanylate cyclase (GGDEF)-like protein